MQGTEYDPIFTPEEREILSRYISNPDSDIFVFLPTLYGLGGAVFARYSRAAGGARVRLLKEFLNDLGQLKEDKLQELIARVLIAYGDDSVGELENAHLAMENISNLATKMIEDNRIGLSPIEQSSRYVVYDQKDRNGRYRYLTPQEVVKADRIFKHGILAQYEQTMDFIFETYTSLIEPMMEYFRKLKPENEAGYAIKEKDPRQYKLNELTDEKDIKAWRLTYRTDLRTKTCDTLRGLLPAATLTNVGLSGNGRAYQNVITKLMSHKLLEFNDLGARAKSALSVVIPNYVKRAEPNEYYQDVDAQMKDLTDILTTGDKSANNSNPVDLFMAGDWNLRPMAFAHILYPYSNLSLRDLYSWACKLPSETQKIVMETYCQHKDKRGNRRNKPGRGLEFGYPITFDLIGDFGIYRDLQRQRMLTQQRQLLTPYLGFSIPDEVVEAGFADKYAECFNRSVELYEALKYACGDEVAQYAVLFGFNIRWYMGMNFREAFHFMELRTIPQGHPSYRKLTQQMHQELRKREDLIADLMEFVDYGDYYWSRSESEAAQRRKESKL